MQSPVSDREAVQSVLRDGIGDNSSAECSAAYEKALELARKAASLDECYDTILPISLTSVFGFGGDTPISCRRFMSLASPDSPRTPEEDDLFSSDLSDEQLAKTFGAIEKQGLLKGKLMVAPSGADQSVPDWIDVEKNLRRWKDATNHGCKFQFWDSTHSGVVPGASHALSDDDQAGPRKIFVDSLLRYLRDSVGSEK
ncbi:hypothetical protein TruAng_006303 [Truncatella angustata]|nr:hypothetical protein TruAng_006303 [Truncatella angustata]